jgi:hypothetical protein
MIMTIWTDSTLAVIDANAPYVDAEGVQHLGQRDKSTIPGLLPVLETPWPDDAPATYTIDGQPRGGVIVTGWHIEMRDGAAVKVWDTTARPALSEAEAAAIAARDLKTSAQAALDKSDVTVLRCAEVAVAVPAEWAAYRRALRGIIAGTGQGPLPARPSFPAGT